MLLLHQIAIEGLPTPGGKAQLKLLDSFIGQAPLLVQIGQGLDAVTLGQGMLIEPGGHRQHLVKLLSETQLALQLLSLSGL